jgi:hypothetical protein
VPVLALAVAAAVVVPLLAEGCPLDVHPLNAAPAKTIPSTEAPPRCIFELFIVPASFPSRGGVLPPLGK